MCVVLQIFRKEEDTRSSSHSSKQLTMCDLMMAIMVMVTMPIWAVACDSNNDGDTMVILNAQVLVAVQVTVIFKSMMIVFVAIVTVTLC